MKVIFCKSLIGAEHNMFHIQNDDGSRSISMRDPFNREVSRVNLRHEPDGNAMRVEFAKTGQPFHNEEIARYTRSYLRSRFPEVQNLKGVSKNLNEWEAWQKGLGEPPKEIQHLGQPVREDNVYASLPRIGVAGRPVEHTHVLKALNLGSVEAPQDITSKLEEASHGGTGRVTDSPDMFGKHWLYHDGSISGNLHDTGGDFHDLAHHALYKAKVNPDTHFPLEDFCHRTGAIPARIGENGIEITTSQKPSAEQMTTLMRNLQTREGRHLKYNIVDQRGFPIKSDRGWLKLMQEPFGNDAKEPMEMPETFQPKAFPLMDEEQNEDGEPAFRAYCHDNGLPDPSISHKKDWQQYRNSVWNYLQGRSRNG